MRQVLTDVGELPLALVVQLGSCGVAGLVVDGCLRHGRTDWVGGGMGSAGGLPLAPVSYTHLDVYKRQPLAPSESAPTLAEGVQS